MNKVLIVDDSATMRKMLLRVLRQADLPVDMVVEACNGIDALRRLAEHPDVALVLCDVTMPEMDGVQFVDTVRRARSKEQLPILMVSTERVAETMALFESAGPNGFVQKPLTAQDLRKVALPYLREALRG
jgi:two-component system chemotaxis response regulator CheY